jgi:hypothetical protein
MNSVSDPTATDVEFDAARLRGLPAHMEAQKIAFGPVVFQCVRTAWKCGLLAQLNNVDKAGATVEELVAASNLSGYAISVLLETLLSAGVAKRCAGRYYLTRVGDNILQDKLTQINIDYIHDVCYQGLFALDACLREEKPLGLKALGNWPTIYEGLSSLPEPARTSWFNFDHYYSGSAFVQSLTHVFARKPQRLMDIGANTGNWSLHCLRHDPNVHVTLVDLPIQLAEARTALESAGLLGRVDLHPIDVLDFTTTFPGGMDAVWMSQFLTCFSIEVIGHIFRRVADSLQATGSVWVLDTFWDRQKYDNASYCLINTSPYFTAIASGNSKMYESGIISACAENNGLRLADIIDNLGICHSLLRFEKVS